MSLSELGVTPDSSLPALKQLEKIVDMPLVSQSTVKVDHAAKL